MCVLVPVLYVDARLDATYALATLVIILVIYHLIIEFLLFSSSIAIYIRTPKNYGKAPYLRNLQNYVKLLLYMLSLIFVFVYLNECGCPRDWQWQIGLVAMFLGWLHLIFLTYNFPGTGLYVIMFNTIFFTFFKLILFALLLIGAFSVILFMMFHDPTAKVRKCTGCSAYSKCFKLHCLQLPGVHLFKLWLFLPDYYQHDCSSC